MWLNPLSRKPAFSVKVVPSIHIHTIGLCGFWDASAWGQPECLNISKPPTDVGCFALRKLWSNGGSVNQHTRKNAGRLKLMKVKMHQLLQCISCRRTILLMFLQKMQWTIQNELEIWGWKSVPFDEELCGCVEKKPSMFERDWWGGHLRNGLPEHYGEMVFPRQTFLKIVCVRLGYIYICLFIYLYIYCYYVYDVYIYIDYVYYVYFV